MMQLPGAFRTANTGTATVRNPATETADVCLIVEGCYPYVSGGVSNWLDWLMRSLPGIRFSVLAILAEGATGEMRYRFPANLVGYQEVSLHAPTGHQTHSGHGIGTALLADTLTDLLQGGGLDELARINAVANPAAGRPPSYDDLLNSRVAWEAVREMYERIVPHGSFHSFFWAWRALFGGLFAILKAPLPEARVYHTISTGYAGLLAARAKIETGRPVLVTEHGIYTNERRIEILMADWIADTVDKGLSLADRRFDLRDMWIAAFEAYARTCYQASDAITTLYEDNQRLQRSLDAAPERLQVIANGIDAGRFEALPRAGRADRPTLALIGRVVPIKDIKTFIRAARIIRSRVPDLRALILGPLDEHPEYARECQVLVAELELAGTVEFTGSVDVAQWLAQIHAVVLTSISEAQPLVLLEAGAAGVPCITTDVGSCRELIEGRTSETPALGPGGIVCDLIDPEAIADAASRLLLDAGLREQYGETLRRRVRSHYLSDNAAAAYAELYRKHGAAPVAPNAMEAS